MVPQLSVRIFLAIQKLVILIEQNEAQVSVTLDIFSKLVAAISYSLWE